MFTSIYSAITKNKQMLQLDRDTQTLTSLAHILFADHKQEPVYPIIILTVH